MKNALFSGVIFLAVAEAIALATAGPKDQDAFLFWTLLSAVVVALITLPFPRVTSRWNPFAAHALGALVGAAFGFLWTYFVALMVGPWVGAFSMPILLCWTAAGSAAVFAGSCFARHSPARAVPAVAVFAVIASFAVFLIPLAARKAANEQEILMWVFRYIPGTGPLIIGEKPASWSHDEPLSEADKQMLGERYANGELKLEYRGRHGSGPRSRVVIVIERPVPEPVKLPQPDKTTVFYFQTPNGFASAPQDVPVLKRSISLDSREYVWEGTTYVALGYFVESWDGSAQGSDSLRWTKDEIERAGGANRGLPSRLP